MSTPHRVLPTVGAIRILRVAGTCYVDNHRTISHSRLSSLPVYPNRSFELPVRWFFLVRNDQRLLSHDILALFRSGLLLLLGYTTYLCNIAVLWLIPNSLASLSLLLLAQLFPLSF